MDLPPAQAAEDFLQAQKCLRGDTEALAALRERYDGSLRAILQARGATPTEADDIVADLWGDCVAAAEDKPVLLEKFSGKCALQSWLATVATNRWYDQKRREARGRELLPAESGPSGKFAGDESGPFAAPTEHAIVELLRDGLKLAFAACDAESKICLRLVYLHGLSQREISRMLGWNEPKVSRALNGAMQQIATDTLREINKRDRLLSITWPDILELCETNRIGFL